MEAATLSDAPHLTFVLEHDGPIPLAELTHSLQRLAGRYARQAKGDEDEPRLYVTEVRKGSIVIILVAAAAAIVPVIAGANQIAKFAENVRGLVDHFTGKEKSKEQVTKADCDDMRALAAPVIHTINARLVIFTNESPGEVVNLPSHQAMVADNRAAMERLALTEKEENVTTEVLLVWDQLKNAPGVDEGRSADRAIIQEVDARPRQVTFAAEGLKEQMTDEAFNPLKKAFVVDVKVLSSPTGIAAYRILKLHDVLDRE